MKHLYRNAFQLLFRQLSVMLMKAKCNALSTAYWQCDTIVLMKAKGMTGQLPKFWSYINRSNWMNPTGGSMPEQFVPYYINGLVKLHTMMFYCG